MSREETIGRNFCSSSPRDNNTRTPISIPLTRLFWAGPRPNQVGVVTPHASMQQRPTTSTALSPVALTASEPIEFSETLPISLGMAMTPFGFSLQKDEGGGDDNRNGIWRFVASAATPISSLTLIPAESTNTCYKGVLVNRRIPTLNGVSRGDRG